MAKAKDKGKGKEKGKAREKAAKAMAAGAGKGRKELDPLMLLELQLSASAVQQEVLMRYVANPGNLPAIRRALGKLFEELGSLLWDGSCPDGWEHKNCKCIPPRFFKI